MKKVLLLLLSLASLQAIAQKSTDTRVFELRIYYAETGKLDALVERFQKHTRKLFRKHGMENIAYWLPTNNEKNQLIYVLAYPNRDAREKSWQAFLADPEWKQVQKTTEAEGRIVAKVESVFLTATDYSPTIQNATVGDRVFELRTYTATKGNLPHLHARFRNHTVKLFEKHGMTNIGYWGVVEGQKGALGWGAIRGRR